MAGKRTTAHREPDTSPSRFDRIARRAYEIYQARGGAGGRELEDWLRAEREIDATRPQTPRDAEIIRGV